MEKKLLYVGGGYADIPIILAAKKQGFFVITTGNKPGDYGHAYGDLYCNVDFSNYEAIYQLAKKEKVSAICASCNDFAALSASYTANKLGLLGHDTYEICKLIHHKDLFRQFTIENNIRCPYGKGYESINQVEMEMDRWTLPVIIKPVDLTGGKGINVANSYDEIRELAINAFKKSKAKRIIIEEFIQGARHGFSAFLYKGKVSFYFCDNEHYYKNPYLVSGASCPSNVNKKIQIELCEISEYIAKTLGLVDGIFHVQFIIKNDKPYIIEVCRRPPGDLYISLVQYATGIDYPMWILKAAIGEDCKELSRKPINGFYTRHCIMAEQEGIIDHITIDESIKNNIIEEDIWGKKGEKIENAMVYKAGIIFLKYKTEEEMMDKIANLERLIKIHVKNF